ncbi:hypothetical protein ILUMI_10404 [Ignelater luminosus]|uniref:Reverse transcriptase RNase H-like domain-containing protein n=1 Tax=Ignelater luminosus TaxID=2038154 RepID=A0A8K0GE71_IGNLU|nr:hypothetical protein ILUMI_10404 [Ignelater luminosus]
MTGAQKRYAQIEKELLAILFACEHFHEYNYGKHVVVQTDHKPLVAIFNKPLVFPPLRLQRMLMKIQKYDIELHYVPGKYLCLADTLSRATSTDNKITESEDKFDEIVEAHHITSSPLYPQSNGLVERNVQIVKNSLIKAKQANRDMYLVLLHYRNSPIEGINFSPAQLLMGRTLRDTLPINESLLIPRTPNKNLAKDALRKRQESQRYYYNRGTKPLNPLKRENIYPKTQLKDKEWRPATIENRKEQPRSYMFKNCEGGSYTRNRRFINVIPDIPDDEVQREELPKASQSIREDDNETILNESDFEIFNVPTQSSCGRPIKIPDRLKY